MSDLVNAIQTAKAERSNETNVRVTKRSKVSAEHHVVPEKLSGTNANSSPREPERRRPADIFKWNRAWSRSGRQI